MSKKELLFSLNKDDFKWEFFKSSGPGGQNKNKRDTACKCIHPPSGAIGVATEEREQRRNREKAFERCVKSDKFKVWHRMEVSKKMLGKNIEDEIREEIEKSFAIPSNLLVEVKDESGKWIKLEKEES